jgi:sec-independent protein translocase protein TatC
MSAEERTREEELAAMSFRDHLDELRRRVVYAILALVIAMAFFLFDKSGVMGVLAGPYDSMWTSSATEWKEGYDEIDVGTLGEEALRLRGIIDRHWDEYFDKGEVSGLDFPSYLRDAGFSLPRRLVSITPMQDIITYMIAALIFGAIVAAPILLWQLWAFIGAGLYRNERRAVMSYLPFSLLLFASGASFGYFVMVPTALEFLVALSSSDFMLSVRDYFNFLFLLTVALAFVFQLPLVMVVLTRFGIVEPELYIKYWRHVIVGMFIVGAFLTPPDPVTQVLMAGPMVGLFVLGLFLSKGVARRRRAQEEDSQGEDSRQGAGA